MRRKEPKNNNNLKIKKTYEEVEEEVRIYLPWKTLPDFT